MIIVLSIIFCAGYFAIIFERFLKTNKASFALITGVLCWTVYALIWPDSHHVVEQLKEQAGDFSGIVFFLLAAMTIVEIIDQHNGFSLVTSFIRTRDRCSLLWIISGITFIMSAVIDNMTTTIVMVSLLTKILRDRKELLLFSGMVIIAANAGGAWSPIGDVTTTMLWIGGRISAGTVVAKLIVPSVISVVIPLVYLSFRLKGKVAPTFKSNDIVSSPIRGRKTIFFIGIGSLLFIPIFKTITHLPPYLGALLGLGIVWIVAELFHRNDEDYESGSLVTRALRKIDLRSAMFFLGILCAVAALQSAGVLAQAARLLDVSVPNRTISVIVIGLVSAVIDNVPLVAGMMGMYNLSAFPLNNPFWLFLSFCAGTGGSALVIGSAAGVVAMGIADIRFGWYLKNIAPLALLGYFSGIVTYLVFFTR
jgi:Na+/H+ antiporter NhaD/arsenite permease-like protein